MQHQQVLPITPETLPIELHGCWQPVGGFTCKVKLVSVLAVLFSHAKFCGILNYEANRREF